MNDIKLLSLVRSCVAVCGGFDAKVGKVTARRSITAKCEQF